MSHYAYCGICQGITLHEYDHLKGIRWELCQEGIHAYEMSVVTAKLSTIIQRKVN